MHSSNIKLFSWINSRKLIITLIFGDLLSIFISLIITNIIYNFYFIKIEEGLSLLFLYLSSSYLFGRYKLYRYIKRFNLNIIFFDLFYILLLIITYFFIAYSLYLNQENNLLIMRKLPFFLLSIILSTLSSVVIKKRFIKTYKNKRKFEFYGTKEEYLNIKDILQASNNEFGFILNRKNIRDRSEKDCNGIILRISI